MLSLDEAVATASTGDIWLFRGRSIADRAIQTVTNSPVNHVGMVVAIDAGTRDNVTAIVADVVET